MKKTVSIIIVSYNRPKTLLSVIDFYLVQTNLYELILIDDGSERSYAEVNSYCESQCKRVGIKYTYYRNPKNFGAPYARKKGLEFAGGDYVLWGEDDAFLEEQYVQKLLPIANETTAVFGSIYYGMPLNPSQEEKEKIISAAQVDVNSIMNWDTLIARYQYRGNEPISALFGHALYLCHRAAYTSIEIFCGYKGNGIREETDIQMQLRKAGVAFLYCGQAECYHLRHRAEGETLSGQHRRYSKLWWYSFKFINNFRFIERNYSVIKQYKPDLKSKCSLQFFPIKSGVAKILHNDIREGKRSYE